MSPETRALLDAVRTAEDPTPEDQRRVLSGVHAALAASAAVGAGIGAAKGLKLLGMSVTPSLKLGGLVLGLSAATWIAATALTPDPAHPSVDTPSTRALSSSVAPVVPAPQALPSSAPSSTTPPSVVATSPAASPAPTTTSPPSTLPSLRDEIALLSEVNAALARGDGTTALRRLDEHDAAERRLLAERKAARIRALCLLGRTQEAQRLAQLFFREHPKSVQRAAVERSCAIGSNAPR